MSATDAKPVPRKNEAYRIYFDVRKTDNTLVNGWINPSGFISKDSATFTDTTNTPTEIAVNGGCGFLDLTAAEMNADGIVLKTTINIVNAVPTVMVLYPESWGDYRCDANVVMVSGAYVSFTNFVDANVMQVLNEDVIQQTDAITANITQVSGVDISLSSFGASASTIWNYATRVLTSGILTDANVVKVSGVDVGIQDFGRGAATVDEIWAYPARVLTSGILTDANVVQVSGIPVYIAPIVDVNVVQVSGIFVSIEDFRGGGSSAADIWAYTNRVLTSGILTDANVVQVSGIPVYIAPIVDVNVVQVSGIFVSIEDFRGGGSSAADIWAYTNRVLTSGILTDANLVSISGIPVSLDESIDANIIQVSGIYVTLDDFGGTSSGASAADIWTYATRVLTSGILTDANVVSVSGVNVSIQDFGQGAATVSEIWTYPTRVLTSGTSDLSAENIWTYANRVLTSGILTDANIVQVSGVNVSLGDFGGTSSGASASDIWTYATRVLTSGILTDANIVSVSGINVSVDDFGGMSNINVSQVAQYIALNDTVHFTSNFYHPLSGFSYNTDITPRWYVYESGATLLLQGPMVGKDGIVGSYWGSFVASAANGFDNTIFYDVQVSGMVAGVLGFDSVKQFVITDVVSQDVYSQVSGALVAYDAATYDDLLSRTLPSGEYGVGVGSTPQQIWEYTNRVLTSGILTDANIVQVSGINVSLGDFGGTSSGASAADIWTYATRVLTSGTSDLSAENIWTYPTRVLTSGILTDANIVQISGFYVSQRSLFDANVVSVSGIPVSIQDFRSTASSGISASDIWTYTNRVLTSGILTDANIVQVSGIDVSLNDFGGISTGASAADIWTYTNRVLTSGILTDANIIKVSGVYTSIEDFRGGSISSDVNVISVSGIPVSLSDFGGTSSGASASDIWTYANRVLTSGILTDANIVYVSGQPVSIIDFGSNGGIIDVNVVSISGVPVGIDSNSVADSDELSTVGNLLIRRARIIRLIP
jgi:hypothetical protein